jgi:hypothetical protein
VAAGGKVTLNRTTVPAGRYRITVHDRSRVHDFHLVGPRVDRRTGAAFTGTARWNVTLVRGTYAYGSDRGRAKARLRVR